MQPFLQYWNKTEATKKVDEKDQKNKNKKNQMDGISLKEKNFNGMSITSFRTIDDLLYICKIKR